MSDDVETYLCWPFLGKCDKENATWKQSELHKIFLVEPVPSQTQRATFEVFFEEDKIN